MATVIITPNMNLPNPVPGVDPGPDYADNLSNSLNIIDQHNHSPGSGVQITTSGINIAADFLINNNNLTTVKSLRFQPQVSALAGVSDIGCLYEAGVDLYYNDGSGNQIRITQSGSVTGATGTITGLPSGTASASYGAGTFVFQSATNTSAVLDFGSAILRNNTAGSKGLTLSPPTAMAADYSIVLPTLPSSQKIMTLDNLGNMAAPYLIDGTTLTITSNIIQVKNQGIAAAQIANGTITTTQISATAGILQTQLQTPPSSISSPTSVFGTTSNSFVGVTNVTASGTSNGRPIMLNFTCTTGVINDGYFEVNGGVGTIAQAGFFRVVETVSGRFINTGSVYGLDSTTHILRIPVSSFNCVDIAPGASGTSLTYQLQICNGSGAEVITVSNCKLVVVQL